MTWWHWVVLGALVYCVYYLEKIRELLGWIMLFMAYSDPKNEVAEIFLEERRERRQLQAKHPFMWRFIEWWRT